MALIKCCECGKEISDKAKHCPNCGVTIKKGNKTLLFLAIGATIVIIIIVIIIFILNNTNNSDTNNTNNSDANNTNTSDTNNTNNSDTNNTNNSDANNTNTSEYVNFITISDMELLNDIKKNEKAIILYILEECSHCKTLINNIKEIKGYKITIYVVNYKDFTDEEIAEITKGFDGFPTVQLYSNNTLIKQQTGSQETDNFLQFLKENDFL